MKDTTDNKTQVQVEDKTTQRLARAGGLRWDSSVWVLNEEKVQETSSSFMRSTVCS